MKDGVITVLLVEDNAGDVRLVREMLETSGRAQIRMKHADRLSRVGACLAEGDVDAVLLDLTLPDAQGLDTFAQVRSLAGGTPIVVLSGTRDEDVAIRAVQEGAQDYLVKGQVEGNPLVRSIRYAIERKRVEDDRDRIFALSSDVLAIVDLQGRVRQVNPAVKSVLGYDTSEVVGKQFTGFVHVDDRERAKVAFEIPSDQTTGSPVEYRLYSRDGSYKWLSWTTAVDRAHELIYAIGRDFTQRKQLESRIQQRTEDLIRANQELTIETREREQVEWVLSESEERYRKLVEFSPDAIVVHSEGKFVFMNPSALKLLGAKSPEELIGRPMLDVVHPDYREIVAQRIYGMGEHGVGAQLIEEKLIRLDGTIVDAEVCGVPLMYGGRPAYMAIARDITERKQALAALSASEERYRALAETSPDVVFVVNGDGHVEYVNKYGAERMGLKQQQIVGTAHLTLFPPEQVERHRSNLRKVFESGESLETEGETVLGGRAVWLHTALVPLHSGSGEVSAVLGVSRDLTDRKRAEEALAESEARLRAIFERTAVGIVLMDLHGRVIDVNPAMERILGYSRDELIVSDFRAMTHPDDVAFQLQLHEELVGGKREYYQLDKRYVRKDGTIRWAHVMLSTAEYAGGRFILGIVEDVTLRKQALEELALVQAEWQRMFETVHPTIIMDTEHRIIVVNEATTNLLDLDLSDGMLVGRKCYEIFHGTAEPIEGCPMERALRSKQAESEEVTLERASGRFRVWCNPVLGEIGEVARVIHIATDVTERVKAEEALSDYEMRMRAVFESLSLHGRLDARLLRD